MKKKNLIATLFAIIITGLSFTIKAQIPGTETVIYKHKNLAPSYVKMSGGNEIDTANFINWMETNFNFSSEISFNLIKVETDNIGVTHHRYMQLYNNIPIALTMYVAHSINGEVGAMNGDLTYAAVNSNSPTISESTALTAALADFNAMVYMWQVSALEEDLKIITGDTNATYYPKAELVYLPENADVASGSLILCYKFNIRSVTPHKVEDVYVSAMNGIVLYKENKIYSIDFPGTAETFYYGNNRNIRCSQPATGQPFSLIDEPRNIETSFYIYGTGYFNRIPFLNSTVNFPLSNNFNPPPVFGTENGTDAHWGMEQVYDFYLNRFGRNSFDGTHGRINTFVEDGPAGYYSPGTGIGDIFGFGRGNGTIGRYYTLAVMGHEFSHAVLLYSSGLHNGTDESSALNEGFCDIMGATIDLTVNPNGNSDWTIGEEIHPTVTKTLSNPNASQCPDTYCGLYWSTSGVRHANAGVLWFWYFLLCDGGTGINDVGTPFAVTGIGRDAASRIAYGAFVNRLTGNATYLDARDRTVIS
ncbi:MAG: M4 family metallopeptidase [Bacteroidales bacterium]|jgi:Zn-dependent metalloprotease